MLNITKSIENGVAEIALTGRLDTVTAPGLEQELRQILPEANELNLNFADLEYISSAGLRVLLSAHKQMSRKGGMRIVHPNEIIREVFEVTGFSDFLTIES